MACSARKHVVQGKVRAWDLYDGVAYRVAKKLERNDAFPDDVDVLILSAMHGLITRDALVGSYERRMTEELAMLQASVNERLIEKTLGDQRFGEMFILAGKMYLAALGSHSKWGVKGVKVRVAGGRIGEKLRELKEWLTARKSQMPHTLKNLANRECMSSQ